MKFLKGVGKRDYKSKKAKDFIDTYKSPNFSNKESNKFFHTLYQYLNGEEK